MAQIEVALYQQRLETLLPEVKRARAAVGAAIEAKRITPEALDRNREKLALEQRQQLVRYEQERALELEREDMTIRDAREKVKDYRTTTVPTRTVRRAPKRGCADSHGPGHLTQVTLPAATARAPPPRHPPSPPTQKMTPHI